MDKNYKIIKTVSVKHKKSYLLSRSIWIYRYRFYSIISLIILVFLLYGSNINIPINISADGYSTISKNILFEEIVRNVYKNDVKFVNENTNTNASVKLPETADFNYTYADLNTALKNIGVEAGSINIQTLKDTNNKVPIPERIANLPYDRYISELKKSGFSLNEIYPAPETPLNKNFLRIPDYNINAPIIYASFEDMFAKKTDGSIDFTSVLDSSDVNSPLQIRLQSGVVHIPFTPYPGDIGNSYIVGHSSNYAFIKSDYNQIFKPIEKKGVEGQEIIVYDTYGRELKFKLFETLLIEEGEAALAYKNFGDRRVLTLQTSVVTWRFEKGLYPYQRWLVRGELVQ